MYDNITVPPKTKCIKCGEVINGFQSKDGLCQLDTLNFWEVNNFYTQCENCGKWNEYKRKKIKLKVPFEDFEIVHQPDFYDQ